MLRANFGRISGRVKIFILFCRFTINETGEAVYYFRLLRDLEIKALKENSRRILVLDSQICCDNSHQGQLYYSGLK